MENKLNDKIALINSTKKKIDGLTRAINDINLSRLKKDKTRSEDNRAVGVGLNVYVWSGSSGFYSNKYGEDTIKDSEVVVALFDVMLPVLEAKLKQAEAEMNLLLGC